MKDIVVSIEHGLPELLFGAVYKAWFVIRASICKSIRLLKGVRTAVFQFT
jgi:hypothetical protein